MNLLKRIKLALVAEMPNALYACELNECRTCNTEAEWRECSKRLEYERMLDAAQGANSS